MTGVFSTKIFGKKVANHIHVFVVPQTQAALCQAHGYADDYIIIYSTELMRICALQYLARM